MQGFYLLTTAQGTGKLSYAGRNLFTFGDSITAGVYSTPSNTSGWTTGLAALTGMIENNHGEPGSTIEKRSPIDPLLGGQNMIDRLSLVPAYDPETSGLLVFNYGMNDAGYNSANYNIPNFLEDYTTVLTHVRDVKGWNMRRVLVCSLPYPNDDSFSFYNSNFGVTPDRARFDAFAAACADIADLFNTQYLDCYAACAASTEYLDDLDADGVHPHDAGHAFLATTMANFLL